MLWVLSKNSIRSFWGIEYTKYPIQNEAACGAAVYLMLRCTGLEPLIMEVQNALGRSDIEVDAGNNHWVLEFKFASEKDSAEGLCKKALSKLGIANTENSLKENIYAEWCSYLPKRLNSSSAGLRYAKYALESMPEKPTKLSESHLLLSNFFKAVKIRHSRKQALCIFGLRIVQDFSCCPLLHNFSVLHYNDLIR